MKTPTKRSVVCSVGNAADPYEALSVPVESGEYWRWGSDNRFPKALALMSRRSTTHRRIINDKADYITGKGFAFDTAQPLLGRFIERANGSGETLRQVINKIAYDKSLFGKIGRAHV